MRLFRGSIGRLMVVIAVIAFDCESIRRFVNHPADRWAQHDHRAGGLASGAVASLGAIALIFSRGRCRTFAVGFLATGVAAGAVLWLMQHTREGSALITASTDRIFQLLPPPVCRRVGFIKVIIHDGSSQCVGLIYNLWGCLIVEAVFGLAISTCGLAGGPSALLLRQIRLSIPTAPVPIPT